MFNKIVNIIKYIFIADILLLNGCIMQREVNSSFDIGLVTDTSHYAVAIFEANKKDIDTVKFDFAPSNGYILLNIKNKSYKSRYNERNILNKILIFNNNECINIFNRYINILYNEDIPINIVDESIITCHPVIYTRDEIYKLTNKVHIQGYFTCCFVEPDGSIICKSTDNDVRHKFTRVIL